MNPTGTQTTLPGMDMAAVNLAQAIRSTESGGDYNAKGKSGESGAYQWTPSTWSAHASQILGDPKAPMTPANQNAVAYGVIKSWKDSGLNAAEIAAKWNSGSPTGWENKIGTNSQGVAYNVPLYVKSVTDAYQQLKSNPNADIPADPNNPSSTAAVEPDKSWYQKVGDFFTGGTQQFGKTIGESLAAPGNAQSYAEVMKSWNDQTNNLNELIKQKVDSGQDPSHLQMVLKEHLAETPNIEKFTGNVINKSAEQVLGEGAQSGLEALSGGILSGGAKAIASKELGTLAKLGAGAKIGAIYGGVGGAANAMQNDGSIGEVLGSTALGSGVGAVLGGTISGAGILGGKVANAIDRSGVINKILPASEARITRMQTAAQDAEKNIAKAYQKALPLTPSQQVKEASLLSKTGDNVYTTLAHYGIDAGSTEAIPKLQAVSDHFANAIEYAKHNEHGLFNLEEIKANANNHINQSIPSETGRIAARNKIDSEISALMDANKGSVVKGASGETLVNSDLVDRLRKTGNSWTNFNASDPEKIGKSTGYALSNAVRDQVEKQGTFPAFREANRQWGKIIHAQEILQKMEDSGKPFKTPGGLAGSISRKVLSGILGLHTGGISGLILSEMGSEYGAKILSNPSLKTYFDRKLIERFGSGGKATPEVISKLIQEVEGHVDSQKGLLQLPAPSSIQLGPQSPPVSSVKMTDAKAISIRNPKTGRFDVAYTSEPKNTQGGFIKGADGGAVKKIHPDDKRVMKDFTDYVAGDYRPSAKEAHQLELDASRIKERYNIKNFSTVQGLANEFGRILDNQGLSFGKITKNPLVVGAAALGAAAIGSKLLTKRKK